MVITFLTAFLWRKFKLKVSACFSEIIYQKLKIPFNIILQESRLRLRLPLYKSCSESCLNSSENVLLIGESEGKSEQKFWCGFQSNHQNQQGFQINIHFVAQPCKKTKQTTFSDLFTLCNFEWSKREIAQNICACCRMVTFFNGVDACLRVMSIPSSLSCSTSSHRL
jgi:hypothetical protein